MTGRQRIVPVRRQYNQWVANQTLEDFALRFTATKARRWSAARVGHTALSAISFLALEAIGGAITVAYGFTNAVLAIAAVGTVIFLTSLPIAYNAAKYGVDIDLLSRGAGFGYIGSTVTSLIYATFTFIFFALEAAIMALALEICFGLPLALGYLISSLVVIPLVTHGITLISRFQIWTQPLWVALHILPFAFIFSVEPDIFADWAGYAGPFPDSPAFDLVMFGMAATIIFALVAQIGEQVDVLRFLPRERGPGTSRLSWWLALLAGGPGWIIVGALKMFLGSILAVLAIGHGVPADQAVEPTQMYLVAFGYVSDSPQIVLALMGIFVVLSQLKINVTNAYAGSIAWSNFFSRLTHSHPGRVVWLVFNVAIALMLMELGIYRALEETLGVYSILAVSWVAALVADLAINKPLGLSPRGIEFRRAHLFDINPVGVGAMTIACLLAIGAYLGLFGHTLTAFAPAVALTAGIVVSPLIALATRGRYYLARRPRERWKQAASIRCRVCEHDFEPDDMAHCPVYSGAICSLCCSLDARCRDGCKPHARAGNQIMAVLTAVLPGRAVELVNSRMGHFTTVFFVLAATIGAVLSLIYLNATYHSDIVTGAIAQTLWASFFVLAIVAGIAAWLFVLAHESRGVAEAETRGQTRLLMHEIEAHRRTDAALQKAKEVAESANLAKSRFIASINHELRSPLSAILGYSQLIERDDAVPPRRRDGLRVIRRSAEHLNGLIDGLLDISRIEAGHLQLARDEVRFPDFLRQLEQMFVPSAEAKGLRLVFVRPVSIPEIVGTDEKRLRQVLINLLSNAIKFTEKGSIELRLNLRSGVAEFVVADTGLGIPEHDMERIFEPFQRSSCREASAAPGAGLGLTISKMLVEIMGGEITLESRYGHGTDVRVRLLLSEIDRPRIAPIGPRVIGYRGPRMKVLVADDDPDHRVLMRDVLEPLGFLVSTAEDGLSCLEHVRAWRPDLLLLDQSMPGLDGASVASRLRRQGAGPRILFISANGPEGLGTHDENDRPYDILPKPIRLDALFDLIGAVLGLDWIEAAPEPDAAVSSAPIRLEERHVRKLRQLGRIGHVRGIEAQLSEIERQEPASTATCATLRSHIRVFDIRGFMRALEVMDGP